MPLERESPPVSERVAPVWPAPLARPEIAMADFRPAAETVPMRSGICPVAHHTATRHRAMPSAPGPSGHNGKRRRGWTSTSKARRCAREDARAPSWSSGSRTVRMVLRSRAHRGSSSCAPSRAPSVWRASGRGTSVAGWSSRGVRGCSPRARRSGHHGAHRRR